jgi:hypothetical protein
LTTGTQAARPAASPLPGSPRGATRASPHPGHFPSQDDTDWLTPSRLASWLRSIGYTGRKDPAVLHTHLTAAAPGPTGPAGAAAVALTRAFVAALTAIVTQIHTLVAHIAALAGSRTAA